MEKYIYKKKEKEKWKMNCEYKIFNYNIEDKNKKYNYEKHFKSIKTGEEVLIVDEKNELFLIAICCKEINYEDEKNEVGFIIVKIHESRKLFSDEFNDIINNYKNDFSGYTFNIIPGKLMFIMDNEYRITNILDYLKKIKSLNSDNSLIFRGQVNKDWKLIPSLYRNKYIENKEKKLYQSIIKHNFKEFEKQEEFINEIIHMQHYGIPTCMLDWTKNPLIALFFAISGENNSDGRIFIHYPDTILEFHEDEYEAMSDILKSIYKNDDNALKKEINKIYRILISNKNYIFVDPILENNRLKVQSGLFSITFNLYEEQLKIIQDELLNTLIEENIKEFNKYFFRNEKIDIDKKIFGSIIEDLQANKTIQNILNKIVNNKKTEKEIIDENILYFLNISSTKKYTKENVELVIKSLVKYLKEHYNVLVENIIMKNDDDEIKNKKYIMNLKNEVSFIVPYSLKKDIKEELEKIYGISSVSVYPDLEGYIQYMKDNY